MLKECKLAMRITATVYDGELCSLMDAAAKDLTAAGVILPGTVAFSMTNQGIVDSSTLTDALPAGDLHLCADELRQPGRLRPAEGSLQRAESDPDARKQLHGLRQR